MGNAFFGEYWSYAPILRNADGIDIGIRLLDRYRMGELERLIAKLDSESCADPDLRNVFSRELEALRARKAYLEKIAESLPGEDIGREIEIVKPYQRMTRARITGSAAFLDRDDLRERFRCPKAVMLKRDGTESAYTGYAPEGSFKFV